ncbi:hypothetical protein SAMN04488063_0319 [Halopelagius inordinatus]|uniref:Uncharacterized protein n=1 Tax=Halopelagius inordinatus TaxID=553467 RepID=A0A1I2LQD9_9EURY|nr:DUF6069 family protein [Halopelagius inordinatus]SFF79607.1 hypothetical protein SAMN04488063_0319 [Halopelagius inordinatus]
MATTTTRYAVPADAGELARRTTLGVLVAVVALLFARGVVTLLGVELGATGATSPFALGPLFGSAVFAGVGAAVAYAASVRLTDRPVRSFVAASAVVFAAMLVPVVTVAPTFGVTTAGQVVLVVYHVAVAVPLVAFVTGAVRP